MRPSGRFHLLSRDEYRFSEYLHRRLRMLPARDLAGVRTNGEDGLVSIILQASEEVSDYSEVLNYLVKQTYSQWEVIIQVDRFYEEVRNFLDYYAASDQRIRIFHPDNLEGHALHVGSGISRGEFLIWIDSVQHIRENTLEKLVASLNSHQDWDAIYISEELYDFQLPILLYRRRAIHLLDLDKPLQRGFKDDEFICQAKELLHLGRINGEEPFLIYKNVQKQTIDQEANNQLTKDHACSEIWDDFRRDLFLLPGVYWLHSGKEPGVMEIKERIRGKLQSGGHIVLEPGMPLTLPSSGLMTVWLSILAPGEAIPPPPEEYNQGVLKALLLTSNQAVLDELPEGWDVILWMRDNSNHPEAGKEPVCFCASDEARLLTVLDIRARIYTLNRFEGLRESYWKPEVKITTVVCTYRSTPQLRNCLASLAAQQFPQDDYEVLVVNNALPSSNAYLEVRQAISSIREDRFTETAIHFRMIDCPIPGLSSARNTALVEARGEVICFLDDDAYAEADWLQSLWDAYNTHPEAGVIGGVIHLQDPQPRPLWYRPAWRRFWSHLDTPGKAYIIASSWKTYPWGANWSARRTVLMAIGGFRSRYGRRGKSLSGGEEIVAASMIHRLGYEVGIEPGAVVYHNPDPARFTLGYLWRAIWANRRTWYTVQKDGYVPSEISIKHSLGRIIEAFRQVKADSLAKPFFTTAAELSLIGWELGYFLRRLRR